MKKILLSFLFVLLSFSLQVSVIAAEGDSDSLQIELGETPGGDPQVLDLGIFKVGSWGEEVGVLSMAGFVASLIFSILFVVWIFLIIIAAIKIIRSRGSEEMMKGGIKRIQNVLAGITIGLVFFIAVSALGWIAGAGNVYQWSDSFQECSCVNAPQGEKCYFYKFQAEAASESVTSDQLFCGATEGKLNYGKGWYLSTTRH